MMHNAFVVKGGTLSVDEKTNTLILSRSTNSLICLLRVGYWFLARIYKREVACSLPGILLPGYASQCYQLVHMQDPIKTFTAAL